MVESIEELRKICASRDSASEEDILVNWRKISIYLTKLLLYTDITANQVTILGTVTGIIGGIFLIFGNPYTVAGALLLHLSFIFDLVDGEVARYRKSESLAGIYLELLSHHIVNSFVVICISLSAYIVLNDPKVFIFGLSAILSQKLVKLAQQSKSLAILVHYSHHRSKDDGTKDQLRSHNKENIIRPRAHDSEEKIYLASISQILYKISRVIFLSHGIMVMSHLILFASLVDMVMPLIMIGPLKLNILYIILIFYGTFSHLVWLALIFLTLKTKSLDKMYSLLPK